MVAPDDSLYQPSPVPGVVPGSILALLASAGYLASYYKYFSSMAQLDEIKALHEAAGADDIASAEGMIILGLVGGAVGILAAILGFITKITGTKAVGVVYLLALTAGSALMIVGPMLFSAAPTAIWEMLEPHPLTASPRLTAAQQGLTDMSAAVYNKCCDPYTQDPSEHQAKVPSCEETTFIDDSQCGMPTLLTAISASDIQELVPKLCTCHKIEDYNADPTTNPLLVAIEKDGLCESLQEVVVDISPDTLIPTTDFKLSFAIGLTPYSQYVSLLTFQRLVGDPRPPTYPGVVEGTAYGCGLGFAKGVSWVQFLFLDQLIAAPVVAGYICGGLNLLIVILTLIYWVMPDDSADQEFMYSVKA